MADIAASSVKELREKTGAGILDCRKALAESGGDLEAAVDWLRKKGLAAAAKKSGRTAAEGLVALAVEGTKGAIIELNSETDFVARNEQFQQLAGVIAETAVRHSIGEVEELKNASTRYGKTVAEGITWAVTNIGEHINLRRCAIIGATRGVVASYIHNAVAPGLGKIGVLVALESEGDVAKLEALGRQIAMHIAAARPDALTTAEIDPARLERERAVFAEQAAGSGKPPAVIEKMVEGRIRKYYEEVVLLEQLYVVDGKRKVSQVIEEAAKDIGGPVKILAFARFQVGEGVEKQETDFAAEVKAAGGAR